jgi:hypothetical protein
MTTPGGKTISFFSGILIGVLAGLGLFFLLVNDLNPFSIFSNQSSSDSHDTVVDRRSIESPKLEKIKKTTFREVNNLEQQQIDSSNSIQPQDSTSLYNQSDNSVNSDEIIVKRDELIEVRDLKLILLDKSQSKNKSDSLLKVFQGNTSNSLEYRIEFWKSPVNYKGFKFIRNVIVAFGLDNAEPTKLFFWEDKFYLKHGSIVYKLFITEKFESFSRVTDENTLKQFR